MNAKKYSIGLITLVASLGGFLFGFDMAVVSGVLPLVKAQYGLSAASEGWFVSSALVGCIAGVALSGELSDRSGRRFPMLLSAVLFVGSALGCALLPGLSAVIVSRILGGIGIGIASNVVPLYISEIAPAAKRGRLVTYYQLALTMGILCAYLSNAALVALAPGMHGRLFHDELWRGMFLIGAFPAVIFFIGLFRLPESPRWLLARGRRVEALAILSQTGETVQDLPGTTRPASYQDLLSPKLRGALIIGLLLPLFSQFSGINAIIYYGPRILSNAGVSLSNSLLSQVIFGMANMLFTLVAIWKVDSWGRRPLYLYGTAGATVTLALTGLCFYTGATGSIWLLLCVLAFLACFAFSIGPLKFVIASEIFPGTIRGRAMALSVMVMWIADTVVGQLTPLLLSWIGSSGTFWFFGSFCLVAFFTVYRLLPETKGRSLEHIENNLEAKNESPLIMH
ncbi:MFS transporter [Pedobacter yulinensis]|uniref:MFS transporter n=1 Tax=Pedobacter yulinensis TaxID=2126353 RepID=A0A2T3HHB6_9SPHI|nr:sugar porter family MFS transporter [Pedobacter yulinensis]PST81834.1 MFS transporter [Pedobacter yulinensis]